MQSVHTINRNTKFISRPRLITRVVFLLLLTFHLSLFTSAQQIHPVTTAVQLVPPYSVYLPDYAAPGNDKLRVILTLNDITQPSYRVKLALKVELNGRLIMQTNPAFQPQPLDLLPGQPVIISGADLSHYLSPANLQFSGGFSRENYERTKSLPEGAYRICFTAYDYNRPDRVQLSNEGCNMFFFKKSEPPVLNLPFHRSRVEDKTPQFLTFSWSDRNTPSMQGGAWSRPSYRFELFEVRPVGSNPEYIVRSSKPLFSTTTEQTNLVYGPAEPLLQDSMQYVWRVQAFDREGRDAYSNSGYSQAYLFTYGGVDPFQVNQIGRPVITGESLSERSGRWNWTVSNKGKVDGWKIQYRKRTTSNDQPLTNYDWNSEELSDTLLSLFNLEADNAYEARVQARVKGIYGPWSEVAVFRTLPKRVFECGQDYEQPEANTGQPLQAATAGMLVRVGDFDMQLLKVEGSNGFFSGYGAVTTPLLGMRVNVKFTGIGINDKLVMTSGEVVALSQELEEWIKDQNKHYRGGDDVGKVVTGDIKPTFLTELDIISESAIRYDSISQTITITGSNKITTKTFDVKGKTFPIVIQDTDEELYQVSKDGKVQKLGKRNSNFAQANTPESLNSLQLEKGKVIFTAALNYRYGFDEWKEEYSGKTVLEDSYEKLADGNYRVPVKAMVPGATETVRATLEVKDNSIKAERVQFVTAKGIAYPFERSGNIYTITLTGGPAGDAQELFAIYPTDSTHFITLGKLLVVSYAPKTHKVALVPIGGVVINRQALSQQLNQVFNPIGVQYEVVEDESFRANKTWDTNNNKLLDVSPSALLSNGATGEMKELIKAYRKDRTIDKQTSYVFVLDESSKEGLLGEMARGEQFGYVFIKDASTDAISRTLAHELGHGRYKLEHTFNGGIGLPKGSTDNLMDYASGTNLLKYQWDAIHDPGVVWGVLEKDGDGEDYRITGIDKKFANQDTSTVSFFSRAGTVISLPYSTLGSVLFTYGSATKDNYLFDWPLGLLQSFTLEVADKSYQEYVFDASQTKYINKQTGESYTDAADYAKVDGVLYPLLSRDKYVLYKFEKGNLAKYDGNSAAINFLQQNERFQPFATHKPKLKDGVILKQELSNSVLYSNCNWCANAKTATMTEGYNESPALVYVDKIAQVRVAYPEYFEHFTQGEEITVSSTRILARKEIGNWEMPNSFHLEQSDDIGTITDDIPASHWPWGKYLEDHPEIKGFYQTDRAAFFKVFLEEFNTYINASVKSSSGFWAEMSEGTDVKDILAQVKKEALFQLQQAPANKKQIALKKIINATSLLSSTEEDFIKLLSSFKEEHYKSTLQYIEQQIGLKTIYDNFYNHSATFSDGKQNLTGVLALVSHMLTKSGHSTIDETKEASYLGDVSVLPQLEADLFRFKNVNWSFAGNNSIAIEGYGNVPYNQVISVRIAGSFTFNNQRFAKGTVLQMPAIQVALMSHVNTVEVSSKATWMVVDLGTLAVGIGGAKILFTTGNYIRKAVVAADLVGSTAGMVVQTLNNDAISDELRSKIQIAGFLSTLPNVMASVPKINKVVDELDAIIETRTGVKGVLTEKELAEVQNIRNSLNSAVRNTSVLDSDFADDAAEMSRRVVTLGSGDVNSVKEWLGAISDGKLYVVAHGEGNVFKVLHNGEEVTLSHRSLAQWIKNKNIPDNQPIVLLSCSDVNTAQNLVNKLGRSVIANDGWVKVFDNGFIQGEKKFRLLTPHGNPATAAEATAIGKQGVIAGTKAVKLQGGWTGFIDELNWDASLKEALKADLAAQADFRVLFINAANRNELASAWKALNKHTKFRANSQFLENVSSFSNDLLKKLDDDLLNPKWAEELKTLFKESPDDVENIWKQLKDDPSFAWEISKTGDNRWQKWSQREFFKTTTAKGKGFETNVCLVAFKNRLSDKYLELKRKFNSDFGKNLDEYDMYSQVQLKYDGDNYFVADQLFVKYKTDALGRRVVDDMVVIENKLSNTTPLTIPQTNAFARESFIIRSLDKLSEMNTGLKLQPGSVLNFSSFKQWYKVHDGTHGDIITGIIKM